MPVAYLSAQFNDTQFKWSIVVKEGYAIYHAIKKWRHYLKDADTGIFLWPLLVKAWDFTRSKEDTGSKAYGVPTRQGNYEIFPRYDQLPH